MANEFQMTNDKNSARELTFNSSFGFRHSLVISVSSLVIRVLAAAIRIYQLTVSSAQNFLFGGTSGCRFTPTCSQYAVDAFRSRGAMAGSWLAAKRTCRCHPFGKCGHDPVLKTEFRSQNSEAGI